MNYRDLTPQEIQQLEAQGCSSLNWNLVKVHPDFSTEFIKDVIFSGDIRLGVFESIFTLPGGMQRHSGICKAALHNVTVGNNCCIINVQNHIANYEIGDDTLIENVGVIIVDGESTFGNGVEVSVLNETGGREVMIHNRLSAHQAYIMALYRHRPELIAKLRELTLEYAESVKSAVGKIGRGVQIVNCQSIKDVCIGDACHIFGTSRLENGTINSNEIAPVHIGQGVICDDFIICSGSHLSDGAMLSRCFVGQSCKLGHGYMASDSLFFCNCQGENGEACAIFAGPFTVTHHKSTLLIAGMFSFMNAGSGSNQSNHMYKLGPIHQGTLERGAKTTSDSYVLWPARVGAFSLVMGRHVNHSDTSNLPFSYLIEQQNTTYLVPGVNLRSVGTIRDAQKWPKRDGRKDSDKLDCINYNLLSPYTVQKMMKGMSTLKNLRYASGELSDIYSYHSAKIRNSSLKKGIQFYTTAVHKFLGNSVISRLRSCEIKTLADLQGCLKPSTQKGSGQWADVSGLIAPQSEIQNLLDGIENGTVQNIAQVNEAFAEMHNNYYTYEWTWAYEHLEEFYGIDVENITVEDVIKIVELWKEAVVGLDKMVYEDAKKEFNLSSMTGFGADGSKEQKEQDFEQVRGDFESNSFVNAVLKHIETKSKLGDETIEMLKSVVC